MFLLDRKSSEGLAIGWDYLGHWRFKIGDQCDTPLDISLELAGFEKDLLPARGLKRLKRFW